MNYISKRNIEFSKFKNIHEGESAIIFCTGPSLNQFKTNKQFDRCIKVGVNKIYGNPTISKEIDYYFFGSHYHIDEKHRLNIHKLRETNTKAVFMSSTFTAKFGDGRETGLGNINKQSSMALGAIPFEVGAPGSGPGPGWVKEIDKYPFYGGSIAFIPVQFLLFAGVKTIYIVGADLGNSNSHFYNSSNSGLANDGATTFYKSGWKKLPDFLNKEYPDVKVCSINPVGLKGVFKDIYV